MAQQPSRHTVEWIKQQQAEAGVDVRKALKLRKKLPLWLDDSPFDRVPERVPLPESRDGSSTASDPGDRDGNAAKSSLEAIDRDDTFIQPWLIPLPPSLPPSPRQQLAQWLAAKESKRETPLPRKPYRLVLDRAESVFDHIKRGNIRKNPRLQRTSITLYEYYDDSTATRVEIDTAQEIPRFCGMREGLKGRVFLVEDLSTKTINTLGETFGITPEFFEEHLLNSGYGGAKYDDPPARSWKTARLNKPYVSLQWFRPVYRRPPLFSNRDREKLLDLQGNGLKYISGNSSISLKAATNIFRAEWDLRVDPRRTAKEMGEFGLVERASIWKKQDENMEYETVIVLLDPLPTISISHDLTLRITKETIAESGGSDNRGIGNSSGMENRVLIIEGDNTSEGFAIPIENPRREETSRPVLDWLLRRRRPEVDRRKVHVRTSFQVLVKQMAPRKPITIDLEEALLTGGNSLSKLQEELNETRSTRQAMHDIAGDNTAPIHVLQILFQTIHQDTSTLLGVLNQILSDIEVDILDDTKMEDRLASWRQLISKAEGELLELKTSTKSFVAFLGFKFPAETSAATSDDKPGIIRDVVDLFQEIDQMLTRLRHASTSLTSNMGLLDSRRSIDEAHAVTRLTELAFLFIPLSFSSSIFGMEIEPFKDPVPLWNFFVVAISVTAFAYLMRLTMRSQWLGNLKQSVKQDVRRYAEQNGMPVQVRSLSMLLLLQWFGSILERSSKATWSWIGRKGRMAGIGLWRVVGFPVTLTLLIGTVAVAPIAVLWTRDIDRGVQGAVTFVIILALVGLVGVPYWRRSDANFRSAFPRFVMRLLRRIPPSTRSLLLWATGIAGCVVIPLALIWTRPLASGIKAGLTAAILVILIPFVVFLGLRGLLSVRRVESSDTGESFVSSLYSYASDTSYAASLSEATVRQPRSSHSQRTNNP